MSNELNENTTRAREATTEAMREAVSKSTRGGKKFWRSVEELAETPEFHQWVEDEFPNRKSLLELDRRNFLKIAGASLALAGLTGCRDISGMAGKAVPYVKAPEEMISGKPLVYATTVTRGGYGMGVLVEAAEGRPVKIEGNPRHASSLGATDVWTQAEILNFYDPDRLQNVVNLGEVSAWDAFVSVLRETLKKQATTGGDGIRILTETVTSPTLRDQMTQFLAKYPGAKWIQYEPVGRGNVHAGTKMAFGAARNPVYRLRGARVIVSLDADFLQTMLGSVRYAREFSDGRRIRKDTSDMNRLYVAESAYTLTGASADHRFPLTAANVERLAFGLYATLVSGSEEQDPASFGMTAAQFGALVEDVRANAGTCVFIPGDEQSPVVHMLAHLLNRSVGAVGKTVIYTEPLEAGADADSLADLKTLVSDMNAGNVQLLVTMGNNPAYNTPADLKFAEAMLGAKGDNENIPVRVHLSLYADETAARANWVIPQAHMLEAWSDARGHDGTVSLAQPMIEPLYGGKSVHEFMAELLDQPAPGYDIVRSYWAKTQGDTAGFEKWWMTALYNGVVPNTALPAVAVPTTTPSIPDPVAPAGNAPEQVVEVTFRPDPSVWDGRYANNSWLQELPKPITTVVWDNVAVISPKTARKFNLIAKDGKSDALDIAQFNGKKLTKLRIGERSLEMPFWVLPGQPDDTVTIYLGYGRTDAGVVGNNQGFATYDLRTSETMYRAEGVTLVATNKNYMVACTQAHHLMRGEAEEENRDIVRVASLKTYQEKGGVLVEMEHHGEAGAEHGEAGAEHAEGEHSEAVAGESEAPEGVKAGHGEGEFHPEQHPEKKPGGGVTGRTEAEEKVAPNGDAAFPNRNAETYPADDVRDIFGKQASRDEWEYVREPKNREGNPNLYPDYSNKGFNAWAMSIDLTTCIGCNACMIACQAENNIPTVGKSQVSRGREMHWIRIDHYYETNYDAAENLNQSVESHFMPVNCMQCEKAPCEPVCPVAATVHSHEGLNQMVYNRCIGTRYCSNNCPYKVRRFNFLKWTQGKGGPTTLNYYAKPQLKMLANPEVTIRSRGVMEKCTYCVQRINAKRIEAKKEGREIRDGEIVTACEQVCPTKAIVFGDINDPNSRVSQLKREPHDYALLAELNTRPRTTYLARIKNPNPALATAGEAAGAGTES